MNLRASKLRLAHVALALASASLAVACTSPPDGDGDGDGQDEVGEDEDGTDDAADQSEDEGGEDLRPNWHQDVAPLVAEACGGCHLAGGIAPFSLEDYASASPWAGLMADAVEDRRMPPWHAAETDECEPVAPYRHDPRLSDEQITMLRDWSELGAPEGDPELAAPLPEPPLLELANPTTTVLNPTPVEVEAQGNVLDFTHCLSFDPGNDEEVYLDGLQVVPGNRKVLHHVLMYVDESAESASWEGGVKYDCGGGSGLSGSAPLVGAWVPGSLPIETPDGVAVPLPAGARIVYNVHYHATGAGPETDMNTGLALRWTDQAPEYTALFALIGAPGIGDPLTGLLHIPPYAEGHVEEYEWPVEVNGQGIPAILDVRVWTVAAHMHKVGVDMRVWVEDGQGEDHCLVHTPSWDFNWQRFYTYDQPIEDDYRITNGDVVRLRCEYDNTLDNPGVVSALSELGLTEPIDVFVGEGTLDEMCLAAVGVGYKF
ncbi:hypothetical protein PPSIR1_30791 [Plesiocystis pacifica SIR-1]|uniref:Uncharacterized protein n=1 Tax=Plesiocystis pacifica SIR-1 TaxID=391625 RepID=A6GAH1_9BACT|nr:hypothetical protein [Plesiocystis pacifica]EDM77159.1 hypothetical protein PPSIR1_30791 [Plesiocystis pacifica SIR-1]